MCILNGDEIYRNEGDHLSVYTYGEGVRVGRRGGCLAVVPPLVWSLYLIRISSHKSTYAGLQSTGQLDSDSVTPHGSLCLFAP